MHRALHRLVGVVVRHDPRNALHGLLRLVRSRKELPHERRGLLLLQLAGRRAVLLAAQRARDVVHHGRKLYRVQGLRVEPLALRNGLCQAKHVQQVVNVVQVSRREVHHLGYCLSREHAPLLVCGVWPCLVRRPAAVVCPLSV